MVLKVRLQEVLSPALLAAHDEHIRDFLVLAGITPDAEELGATVVTERLLKELMAELAEAAE